MNLSILVYACIKFTSTTAAGPMRSSLCSRVGSTSVDAKTAPLVVAAVAFNLANGVAAKRIISNRG